jgi:hypothetical protein
MRLKDKLTALLWIVGCSPLPMQPAWGLPPAGIILLAGGGSNTPHPTPAPTIVQCASGVGEGVNSKNIPLSAVTAGDTLFVMVGYTGGGTNTPSVQDNIGGATGWTEIGTVLGVGVLFYKANCPSGITSVTGYSTVGGASTMVIAYELAGCGSAPYTGDYSGTYLTPGSGTFGTNSLTNSVSNSIFFACFCSNDGMSSTPSINASGSVGTWALYNSSSSVCLNSSYPTASIVNISPTGSVAEAHYWTGSSYGYCDVLIVAFHQ